LFEASSQWERTALVREAVQQYRQRGGLLTRTDSTVTVKKALQLLAADNKIENVQRGYWRRKTDSPDMGTMLAPDGESPSEYATDDEDDDSQPIERVIGEGKEHVYVYYNANDKELALLKHQTVWENKIGSTSTGSQLNAITKRMF
jgi:hypothetical protein